MADKFHSDTQEKIDTIIYQPGVKDSGDLEAGTHTIVPTSRPPIASAQYSKSLTLPKPGDARLVVKRIASRLSVNIAGLGTATHVCCSVRVDVDDADHELFSEDWTSTGSKLDAVDVHSANKSTIFDLLKDGAAHTFYFLFWADAADQATIDVVQLWEGVGSCNTSQGNASYGMQLNHQGLIAMSGYFAKVGSGTASFVVPNKENSWFELNDAMSGGHIRIPIQLWDNDYLMVFGTVATDLNYLDLLDIRLRSEL